MRQQLTIASLLIALALPTAAHAQFAKTEDAIKYRAATFVVMGTHFSRIGAVVKGEKPFDKNEVAANAAIVASLAHLPWQAQKAVNHCLKSGKKWINSKLVARKCKKLYQISIQPPNQATLIPSKKLLVKQVNPVKLVTITIVKSNTK
jgi:hypothetical protein